MQVAEVVGFGAFDRVFGAALEIIDTKGDDVELVSKGARAGAGAIECRAGRYVVRVTELSLSDENPKIGFAVKQLQKIRDLQEPVAAKPLNQATGSQTNGTPVVPFR